MFDRENSNNNILVYKVDDFDEVDEFTLKMIRVNPIEEVFTIGTDNNDLLLAVSNLTLLDEYLRREDCELTVDDILKQIEGIKSKVEGYMIPEGELILNYEFAYIDEGKLRLPLVPTTYSYLETHTEKEFILCIKDALGDRSEKIEQTEWHNVVCWRSLAEIAEKILRKGTQIYVEGKLQTRSWEDKDGNKRYITEVVADNFTVLANRAPRPDEQNENVDPLASILNDTTAPMGDLPF